MCISLRPSTHIMGVKCQPGVIWGHRGQMVIFSKNATSATEYMTLSPLCYIVYPCYSYICISLKPFIAFMGSRSTCGVISAGRVCRLCRQRCLVTLPEDRQGLVSYSFLLSSSSFFFFFFLLLLLSSSFFWQHIFFTHFPTSDFDQTCSQ